MKLDRVTITGADDSINPSQIVELSKEFPFVEWGILFSNNHQGSNRFPSQKWLESLFDTLKSSPKPIKLCAHLCGKFYVREFISSGIFTFQKSYRELWPYFQRCQLNFHASTHNVSQEAIAKIKTLKTDFIVQYDGVNDAAMDAILPNNPIYPLFDISGGAGIVPSEWPTPIKDYCGYAGGLSPENVLAQVSKIESVVGDSRIWIDMETRVRSDDDRILDMVKVRRVLELTKPLISE